MNSTRDVVPATSTPVSRSTLPCVGFRTPPSIATRDCAMCVRRPIDSPTTEAETPHGGEMALWRDWPWWSVARSGLSTTGWYRRKARGPPVARSRLFAGSFSMEVLR